MFIRTHGVEGYAAGIDDSDVDKFAAGAIGVCWQWAVMRCSGLWNRPSFLISSCYRFPGTGYSSRGSRLQLGQTMQAKPSEAPHHRADRKAQRAGCLPTGFACMALFDEVRHPALGGGVDNLEAETIDPPLLLENVRAICRPCARDSCGRGRLLSTRNPPATR